MNEMGSDRDLAPLDPRREGGRWEEMVRGINLAAADELQRREREQGSGVLLLLSEWRRPATALCTAIAASAAAILLLQPADPGLDISPVSAALGYPDVVATWVESGAAPSVEELLLALEVE